MRTLIRLTVNVGGKVRRAKLEGRRHLVVPAAILPAEGVVPGSAGPLFYSKKDNAKAVPTWNHRPVVINHPKDATGGLVSACTPAILTARKVGITLNTGMDDKLRTECWIDEEKCKSVDAGVLKKIRAGEQIECSTGLYADNDGVVGNFNGEAYNGTATDHKPDHLALLPDDEGAFSVAAGGGLLANAALRNLPARNRAAFRRTLRGAVTTAGLQFVDNELSFSDVGSQLTDLLAAKYGDPGRYWRGYVADVYSNYAVFYDRDKMWMIDYKTDGDAVTLSGDAVEAKRKVEYVTVNGVTYAANSAGGLDPSRKETPMALDKKAHIDALIANGGVAGGQWAEADRPALMGLPDDALEKIKPPVVNTTSTGTTTTPATTPPPAPTTTKAYIDAAPPEIRNALSDLVANAEAEKNKLIKEILLYPRNTCPEAVLRASPLGQIKMLHNMIPPPSAAYGDNLMPLFGEGAAPLTANYGGNAGGPPSGGAAAPNTFLMTPGLEEQLARQNGTPAGAAAK